MKTYTETYILGIKEGREVLNSFPDICPKQEYEGCKRLLIGASDTMKEFYKGQRDFWHNQIKKGKDAK